MNGPMLSVTAVAAVAVVAVLLPLLSRLLASPVRLLLFSPIILVVLAIVFFIAIILCGHILDAKTLKDRRQHIRHAARPVAFSTPAAWQAVLTRSHWTDSPPQSFPPLLPSAPLVSSSINDILILVVRDFVLVWYKELSSSPSFPLSVSTLLHSSLQKVVTRVTNVDLPALAVKRILPKVTEHIELFRQSEIALRGAGLERQLTQSEELDLLLASRYTGKASAKLHPAVDNLSTTFTAQSEQAHLRQLVDRFLPHVLPERERQSKALSIVVREILVCAVLYPIMDLLADPDFWNRTIDQLAGAAIHQQKLISKVRNVLEAQSPRASREGVPSTQAYETITIRTDARQFESFLRSINRCSSLLDARRLKNDIVREIRRTRLLLANHKQDDWINGEKTEDVVAFLDRLYTAKRQVEERIVVLGGEQAPVRPTEEGAQSRLGLRGVLHNPNSLSYFMEFMDRRNRSLLVQFWLTVESFKNPLESVDSDSSGEEDQPINAQVPPETLKEDITMVNDLYFSVPTPHPALASISIKYIDNIRDFAGNPELQSASAQHKVRRSVMLAQRQVERAMEADFEDFERSELWFRAVGDPEYGDSRNTENIQPPRSPQPQGQTIPSPKTTSFSTPFRYGSRSTTAVSVQRTTSVGSNMSGQSGSSSVPQLQRVSHSNIDVLMSPVQKSSEPSRAPLFDDPEDAQQRADEQRMEAIRTALTDIMALEREPSDGFLSRRRSRRSHSLREIEQQKSSSSEAEAETDEVADDASKMQTSFHLAGPGDLQLSGEIERLGTKINSLQSQDAMLDTLIRKAELTGDARELKLLKKSKSAMNRELRQLKFQKLQYEQQESANRLISDRTKVSIVNSAVGEEGGKSVVRYLVEVQQLSSEGGFASGWVVARRYNEFLSMHNKLKEKYALVRNLDFPGKRLVTSLSGSFVDTRKAALEKYLQNIVAIPAVCESNELRSFLSRDSPFVAAEPPVPQKNPAFSGTDLVRNMYRSVAESIDDMFFGPSMLDVMIQRLTRQVAEFAGIVGSSVNDEDLVAQALNASSKNAPEVALMQLPGDLKPLDGETSTSTFSAPICDLILAVFELNKKNNWLRRQAIVIILQQVLGGTIERKLRETSKTFFDEPRVLGWLKTFRDSLWPGGKLKPSTPPRTAEEKLRTKEDANRKLSSLVPDLAANMIGRSNARRGARRMFAVLQNRRLNQHIMYTIVDEVVNVLFPEINQQSSSSQAA
ncbi:hypothetical protein AX16_000287 [Volvariella volvacea WC 439]|nr:hypothetical protein AX16_000287 [Volvariella volvacea WC 439]